MFLTFSGIRNQTKTQKCEDSNTKRDKGNELNEQRRRFKNTIKK